MKYIVVAALAAIALVALIPAIPTQHAFALKKFFACITDASNKAGGDRNLSLQDVIDCFKKELPNNNDNIHSSSPSPSASASASASGSSSSADSQTITIPSS